MNTATLKTVGRQISEIRLAIMKLSGEHVWDLPASFMIETLQVTAEGDLFCVPVHSPTINFARLQNRKVKLKYVDKSTGVFIKVVGRVSVSRDSLPSEGHNIQRRGQPGDAQSILMVKVEEVHCFQKQTISPYTSFLQSVNNFTMNRILAGRGI